MQKYNNQRFSLINKADSIHPKLLIDENAINLRNEVWLIPPKDPIITLRIIVKIKKFLLK